MSDSPFTPDGDVNSSNKDESKRISNIANTMKVKLHYANLKVFNGMTSKSLQEVEQAMVPCNPVSSFVYQEDQIGEQEQAAAQAIMMLSCQRDKQTRRQTPYDNYHAHSAFTVYHQHDPHYRHAHHHHHHHSYYHTNLANYPSLHYPKSRKKKETKSDCHSKRAIKQPLPSLSTTYTAPRRGRPKKAPTS